MRAEIYTINILKVAFSTPKKNVEYMCFIKIKWFGSFFILQYNFDTFYVYVLLIQIRGYRIHYSVMSCAKAELANCNINTTFVDTITAPDLSHTIRNLEYYTEYNIQIELFNGFQTGPRSPKIVIYTDEDSMYSPFFLFFIYI